MGGRLRFALIVAGPTDVMELVGEQDRQAPTLMRRRPGRPRRGCTERSTRSARAPRARWRSSQTVAIRDGGVHAGHAIAETGWSALPDPRVRDTFP